jgi:ATP phosphoribosyltransferase
MSGAPKGTLHRMGTIRIALSKGRILEETMPLLARIGLRPKEDPERSRKLILPTERRGVQLVIVRAADVPTYVGNGAAEIGIAGGDVVLEHGGAGLYQPIDLGIARCRLMVATRRGFDYRGAVQQGARLRIATKYVNLTREHFAAKGVHVDLIKLYGSMELAPLLGLADAIVDLVSSGKTLRANRLVAVEEILPISARLVLNQAALKTRRAELQPLIESFAKAARK